MRPLSNNCREMLMQLRVSRVCKRFVNAPRHRTWQVAGQFFHEFTGDALARRGLIEHYVEPRDGSSFDRYELAEAC